jgi:ABC-type xylose transport system permease subunit
LIYDGQTIFVRVILGPFSGFARSGISLAELDRRVLLLPCLTGTGTGTGTVVSILLLVIIWVLLQQMVNGRRLYAIGGTAEGGWLAGVWVKLMRLSAFAFTGVGTAVAGLMCG